MDIRLKLRMAIRDIENLLGPSFPVNMFCKALLQELKMRGVGAMAFDGTGRNRIIRMEELDLLVSDASEHFPPGLLTGLQGIWVPHKHLILPELKTAAISG